MSVVATAVEKRAAGASFSDAAYHAGIPGTSYQRLQYWVRKIALVRGRIRGFASWSWDFGSLRRKLLRLKRHFGPLTLSRAP